VGPKEGNGQNVEPRNEAETSFGSRITSSSFATALREDLAGMATREGVTIFLTTHNLAEAEKLCGKVGVIADGKLIAAGTPDELRLRVKGSRVEIIGRSLDEKITGLLRAREEVNTVNLQKDRLLIELREKADIAPLITLMVNAGAEIEEVHKASLEETFLKLVGEEK
jgi:ABC-2 type transport system ATP-binding protein